MAADPDGASPSCRCWRGPSARRCWRRGTPARRRTPRRVPCTSSFARAGARARRTRRPCSAAGETLTYARAGAPRQPAGPRTSAASAWARRPAWGSALERSPELVVAVLGVLKAGGAYVPLDPAYPARAPGLHAGGRRPRGAADAARGCWSALPACGGAVVLRGRRRGGDRARAERTARISRSLAPDNLAYVIYTSGSTGRPKGVGVTHRGLVQLRGWAAEAYAGEGHGAPVHSSLSFDLTVTSLLVPLARGERVVLVEEGRAWRGWRRRCGRSRGSRWSS